MIRLLTAACTILFSATLVQAKDYDFAQPPVQALATLTKLKQLSTTRPGVGADELALFADAADGKLDKISFAEAALLASGVTDPAKRKAYLAKIDQLEADARQATASAKTPAEKGQKLLEFLHAGVMKPGYATKQSSLAEILDTGKFNCVSSAVIYNILAQRLGLDARGCLVFGHAFSVVYDGAKPMDVETTNKQGFNPRDPDVLKEIADKTGRKPSSGPRDRKEVRELGLVSSIYANRSADASQDKQFYESLLCGFAALALDPASDNGVQNAKAGLTNWCKHLVDQKQFETALTVSAVGLELAPEDYGVRSNREACFQDWIKHAHATSGEESSRKLALKLIADYPGEKVLRDIARGHVSREMKKLHEAKQYDQALALVLRNRELIGEDREVNNLKAYCWQEWIKSVKDETAARPLIQKLLKDHPGEKDLQEIVRGHVIRGMNDLKNKKQYEEALAYVSRHQEMLGEADTRKFRVSMYDAWAMSFREPKQWQAGIAIYQTALKEYPGDSLLTNNLKYFEQQSKK